MPDEKVQVRTGQAESFIARAEFTRRFNDRFTDPAFKGMHEAIGHLERIAWDAYQDARKSPITRAGGPDFKDPSYELSVDWLATRAAVIQAQQQHEDPARRCRVLLVCASARNDKTCPGEMSKSSRLANAARATLESADLEVDLLDLSTLTSEFGKVIFPCKGCVSTAMPLCHWPCSCYPNYALGQVSDWMSEIYPRWVAAQGVMIITPVYWYQAPSVLKLMIDRLVCADGATRTRARLTASRPRKPRRSSWPARNYPRHLQGRSYAVVVHGDAAGRRTSGVPCPIGSMTCT